MLPEVEKPLLLSSNTFPVVGIGASAGGLDAFVRLLKAIPIDSGMAYVLVQHLDPNHKSILPALLQKVTSIPVLEISDELKVEPNHIYIIPSNSMLVANDGVLQLSPRPDNASYQLNLPIDLFFTSLAEVHRSHAIGVVLSGTASDGTRGLRAIKEHGGITFAQDTASAAYDGMPQSAMLAGVVDFILKPEDIPAKLLEIKAHINHSDEALENLPAQDEDIFRQILSLMRIKRRNDFTHYKQTTVRRRILRRMAIRRNDAPAAYLEFLKSDKEEQDALYQDLLIPVTAFFRDPKVFETLCNTIFPQIVKDRSSGKPIRLWVAGCSTGEEAYSMAICLREFLGSDGGPVQIFATDISEPAIAKARIGVYTKSDIEGVSTQRLQEFFTKTDEGYKVSKDIRGMCVFAVHNFLKDPAFGKMDLVSCRNVLIYMEPYLQKRAFGTFHYSLVPAGFLLLGKSESSASVPDLFTAAARDEKIFVPKNIPGRFMHVTSLRSEQDLHELNSTADAPPMQIDFQKAADDIMLSRYTPPGVVINEMMDIVQFRGSTSRYLEQVAGKPSHNLMKLAKPGLAFELRNIIHKARKENSTVVKEHISILAADGKQMIITIEAIPLPNIVEPHCLILFRDVAALFTKTAANGWWSAKSAGPDPKDLHIIQLEKEHAQSREDMRSITEDQEAANEELQSSNEELLSSSEELQSLNEELETSKEELQSTNEELTVVNQQQNSLNEQLQAAIDAQVLSQKRMEAQAKMVEDLLMTAPGFICTLYGPKHIYGLINERYQQLFGKRVIKGKPIMEALPELEGQGFDTVLDKVYETGEPYVGIEVPITLSRDEGLEPEVRYFNFSYQPMYNEDWIIYSILVFGYEVTEQVVPRNNRKTLQRKYSEELEASVQQRTKELLESNDQLLHKNEELESFNYVASHDLQEPLRKIQIFTGQILSGDHTSLSPTGADAFKRIQKAAVRMQNLIRDLLIYSRTDIQDRKFEVANLNTIMKELLAEMDDDILEKDGIVNLGKLCDVQINVFQFRQMMSNLLCNALKFAKRDVPSRIEISSTINTGTGFLETNPALPREGLQAEATYCHISVEDNGIGFDPVYGTKIFEVFQRLHKDDEYEGTGIGLAIVKKIVENHKGFITATGAVDEGAAFHIYLPFGHTNLHGEEHQ